MDRKKLPLKNAVWQIVASFIAHSIVIQVGISLAYSTILLPQIMVANGTDSNATEFGPTDDDDPGDNRGELIIDKEEASWIASLVTLATPIGSILTGPLMDRFGRKTITVLTAVPFVASWILVILTTGSVYTIYAARMLAGFAGGLSTVAIVYVSEISHPSIRPMLLSLTSVFVSFGILLTLLLNYFLTWKVVAACCGAIAVSSLVANLFIPESPAWIVGFRWSEDPTKGLKWAERNLKRLYKNPEVSLTFAASLVGAAMTTVFHTHSTNTALSDLSKKTYIQEYIQKEILDNRTADKIILDFQEERDALIRIREQKMTAAKQVLFFGNKPEGEVTLRSPQAWKPLLVLFVLLTLQQFSGSYIVIFYAVQIFEEAGSVEVDGFLSVVVLGVVRFVMAILSMFLSKRFGRRPLLITSALGMAASVLTAALWIHLAARGLVPVVCLLFFVLFGSYGVMVIPWTLIGELLPLNLRGKGSGFMVAVAYVDMFLMVKLFMAILDLIGVVLVFVAFSAFSVLFAGFVYLKIPETLGKSFQEIENHFKGPHK